MAKNEKRLLRIGAVVMMICISLYTWLDGEFNNYQALFYGIWIGATFVLLWFSKDAKMITKFLCWGIILSTIGTLAFGQMALDYHHGFKDCLVISSTFGIMGVMFAVLLLVSFCAEECLTELK